MFELVDNIPQSAVIKVIGVGGGGGGGSGSLTGSQFTHMIGSINGTTNSNSKHPLSHV